MSLAVAGGAFARLDFDRAGTPSKTRPARRVLFISYAFPPVGGAGVQRTTKFVKYLPRHGWQSSVLTVANPSVPSCDRSLEADIPQETIVRRARTWEPSYRVKSAVGADAGEDARWQRRAGALLGALGRIVLQPDPQVLWLPGAICEGRRLLNEVPHDVIMASGPPFSSFLVGAALSRWAGIPLVLDYRDEWSLSAAYSENQRPGRVSRFMQTQIEKWAARSARVMLATTGSSREALATVLAKAGSRAKISSIYNGFDPDDFCASHAQPRKRNERYRLAYVGTLWELTSVAPLVSAVQMLAARHAPLISDLELVFAGRRVRSQQRQLARLEGLGCRITQLPYINHKDAVSLVRSADAVCALLSDLPGAERVVPAKIFEYMAARIPILAIAPPGELCNILRNYTGAVCHAPHDIEGITGWLATQLEARGAADTREFAGWDGARYSRDNLAGELATLLDSIC